MVCSARRRGGGQQHLLHASVRRLVGHLPGLPQDELAPGDHLGVVDVVALEAVLKIEAGTSWPRRSFTNPPDAVLVETAISALGLIIDATVLLV